MKKIPFFVVWVGTRCTLRCKNCCNLIPYVCQESYDIDKVIENIKYITEYVLIDKLQIQGGEPFTNLAIDKLIESCAENKHIDKIDIATNGTIKPKENIIRVLKKYKDKVYVRISKYDCAKEKQQETYSYFNDFELNVRMYDFMFENGEWFDSGGIDQPLNTNGADVQKIYDTCFNKDCWLLADDYMAVCGKIINLLSLKGETNLHRNNVINVTEAREKQVDFGKQFSEFENNYKNQVPYLCGYCKEQNESIPAAIQL